MLLTEKYADLLESTKQPQIASSEMSNMAVILENQAKEEGLLKENTNASDVAQFTPILMPLARRIQPSLIANELVGIQPMNNPTGYIYSLSFRYTGMGANAADKDGGRISPVKGGQIIDVTVTGTAPVKGDVVKVGAAEATVIYVEGSTFLIDAAIGTATATLNNSADEEIGTITATYSNELTFRKILKGYTGSLPTSEAELLGYDMAEIGFEITQESVAVKSRKLKAEYTLEMYQDLKAMHGLNADEELMNSMAVEVQNEMDREIIDLVNGWAAPASDFVVNVDGSSRFELESMAHLGLKIANESREIARLTRRGAGNVLLVSPKVATVLEAVKGFKPIENDSKVKADAVGASVIGTFNGMKVVMDVFASSDYCTVLYKGSDRKDAIGYYCPYVGVSYTRVVNPASGQPAVILNTRYATLENPMNSKDSSGIYARRFAVNFGNSFLK
jgi:hypothetical protein